MPDGNSDQVLRALREQGARAEKQSESVLEAIQSLGHEVRGLAQSIATGFSQPRAAQNGTNWQSGVALIALFAALMSPAYIMLGGLGDTISKHENVMGHPQMILRTAHMTEALKEVETQFDGVREKIETVHQFQDDNIEIGRLWMAAHDLRIIEGCGP